MDRFRWKCAATTATRSITSRVRTFRRFTAKGTQIIDPPWKIHIKGLRSFYQKPRKLAEWMIGSGIGCCLRPLGIVMN